MVLTLWLCYRLLLEHGKYYEKKKNIKKNDFLKFGFTVGKYKKKLNIIKILHIIKFLSPYIQ